MKFYRIRFCIDVRPGPVMREKPLLKLLLQNNSNLEDQEDRILHQVLMIGFQKGMILLEIYFLLVNF